MNQIEPEHAQERWRWHVWFRENFETYGWIRVNPGDGLSLGNFSNSTIVNLCWYTKASIYITCRIYYNCSFWLPEAKQSLELLGSPVAHHPQAKRRIAPSANRAKRGVVVWAQTVARRRSVLAWVEKLLVCFSCLFMFASFRVSIDLYAFLMIMMCVYIYIYIYICSLDVSCQILVWVYRDLGSCTVPAQGLRRLRQTPIDVGWTGDTT